MQKEAVAVYNPQDHVGQTVQEAYHAKYGRNLTWHEVSSFVRALLHLDGLADKVAERIGYIVRTVFDFKPSTDHLYVPCHLLELRDVLRSRKKVGPYVAAFESEPALRLLPEYDTLLVVDRNKLPAPDLEIGFHIYSDVMTFDGALVRVLTRERVDSVSAKETEQIVKEEYPDASVHPVSDVPGIAFSKVAQHIDQLKKFIVNIPSLGINNEKHNGKDETDAVNQALYKKWREKNIHFRAAQFTVEYWQQSGFWNEIVRPANTEVTASVKTAEATTLCGNVVRKMYAVGSKSEREAFMLETPKTEYVLRISGGNAFYDKRLEEMVGMTICGIGLVHGDTFIMSSWNELKGEKTDGVVKMKREKPEEATTFQEGDRVRKRNRGISFNQIIGVVKQIKDGLMYVKWDNIKDLEVFKLTDTVQLHARLEKL